MRYENIAFGRFLDRPNRFIAHVEMDGRIETVHVKNTGRCRELLLPGAEVSLQKADNPSRKTPYDLIAVKKEGLGWVNIDSQAANAVAGEWLAAQTGVRKIVPEYRLGDSRFDFYLEDEEGPLLLEIKSCTLEIEGMGFFPDAPTERGVKHLRELAALAREGKRCAVGFVIAMEGVDLVFPNRRTHPAFGDALEEAFAAGVEILYLPCSVTADSLAVRGCIRRSDFGKVMVSACLLGENCKYNGGNNRSEAVLRFLEELGAEAVPVCPEAAGGLPTPRIPAEIREGLVVNREGASVDREYRLGAEICLESGEKAGTGLALLKAKSPSCGARSVYDGTFSGRLVPGKGIFAARLAEKGIPVLDETQIESLFE